MRFILLLLASLSLASCGTFDTGPDFETTAAGTAQELFDEATRLRSRKRYDDAAELYTEVERQFPRSPLAIQAQYERANTLYEGQDYDEAVAAFDRFISFNPGHPLLAKAELTRALCFYDQIPDVYRDQGVTENARDALLALVENYPASSEATNAAGKLRLVNDQLAGHEMVVGRQYQRQGQLLSAQNRFKTVIDDYSTTSQVPEAFYRLVETSLALGLKGEARRYGATLGYNFPSSVWYHRAYKLLTQ